METLIDVFWYGIFVYVFLGILACLLIQFSKLHLLDDSADGGSFGFRIVITPGIILLWPLVLYKTRASKKASDMTANGEHQASALQLRSKQRLSIVILAVIIPILFATALLARPNAPELMSMPFEFVEPENAASSDESRR
jgi:hypothetical protein